MPFPKRTVKPTRLGRTQIQKDSMFDLDCVSNNKVIGVVRQLKCLVSHADGLFCELTSECQQLIDRTQKLKTRVTNVSDHVGKLNAKTVPVPVGDLQTFTQETDHFKSSAGIENSLFTPDNRPPCVQEQYRDTELDPHPLIQRCHMYQADREAAWLVSCNVINEQVSYPDITCESPPPGYSVTSFQREVKELREIRQRPRSCGTMPDLEINPCPTPEARVRELSKSQPASLVAIDVTGSSFTRMCEFRESVRSSSREYVPDSEKKLKKKLRSSISGIPGKIYQEAQLQTGRIYNSNSRDLHRQSGSHEQPAPRVPNQKAMTIATDRGRRKERKSEKVRSKSTDKLQDNNIQPTLSRSCSIRKSLRSLFSRSKSRSRSQDLWASGRPASPGPPVVDLNAPVQRSRSLPRSLKSVTQNAINNDSRSVSTDGRLDRNIYVDSNTFVNTSGPEECMQEHTASHATVANSTIKRSHSHHITPVGTTFAHSSDRPYSMVVTPSERGRRRQPIPVATPTSPSTDSVPSISASGHGGSKTSLHRIGPPWGDVRLRQNSYLKDDRQSSSGNWSGSSNSNRQSLESDYTRSPERRSVTSLDKDSAVSLNTHFTPSDERSTLTDSHSPTEASRGLVISSNSSLTADASSTVTVESNNLNTANIKPDLSSRKLCDFSISQTDRVNKNKQSSESNIDSAESTPVVKPKSYAGLTLQNVRAHEHAYQPQQKFRPSLGDDESSMFSVDQEGFFTSMHRESGLARGLDNPCGSKGQHLSSTTDSSSTVCPSDASVISRDSVKAKRNKSFLSKIKKMTGKKSKSQKVQPPLPLRETSLLNKSNMSEEDFPPPPTPTQLAFNMSTCLSEVSDHFDFTQMSLSGDSPASKISGEIVSPISKKLLNDTTESDPEALYARLKKKTSINAESFPALCLVTPVPSDEEDSDFLTCSTAWRAGEAEKKTGDKHSLDTCGTLPKSPNGTQSENSISGYSTWPRSPAKIVTSSPDTNKSGIYKEAKVVQTPKTLSIVPQGNIFDETIQINTKSVLPPAKTPDDIDTRCMTPTSFKSGSVSSERVPRPPRRKMPSVKTPSVSSLGSGSSGSHFGLSEEQVGEIPAKYQHTITVIPRARPGDQIVNTTSSSRHSLGDRNVTTPTKSRIEHVYANVVLRKPAPSCQSSQLSSGALYTTAGPKAGSVPVLTQPPQNICVVENGKDTASSDNVDGMSTWPKSGKKILLVSNMKKAESSLDSQTSPLSTFGTQKVIDSSKYVAIPVSISQVTRPSTLPISSSGVVVPASAQLIISSPTATKVCHQENPYRRSVCSPVTDEELEKFGLYDTSSDQWYNTMPRNFKTSQGGKPPRPDPAVRCHSLTRPRSAIIRSQSFSQTQTKPSEPLYPSINAMKHSISFPVKIQAKDTLDKNHRSWYDGISDNEENRSRPVSQPLDWIPDPFSDLKLPVSTKCKRPKLDSDPPSHGAPFRLGTRSNFAAFQMASNQQSAPVCSSPGTSCTRIDDFTFTISSNAVVGEPSVESSNTGSRKRPSFSSFLKSPSPSSPQTPTWSAQSPDTSPVMISSPNTKVSAFEALNQIRMDKQLKTLDSPVSSQNALTPVAVEPPSPKESPSTPTAAAPVLNPAEADWGCRLSTIMEASESEAEGKSGPTSPVPRVLTQSPIRSLSLSIDSSTKSEHILEVTKNCSQGSNVQSNSNIKNRPNSLIQLIATKTPTVVPNKSSSVSHKKSGRATLISKSEADSLFNGNKTEKSESRTSRKSETDHKIVCSKDEKCGVKPDVSGTISKLAVKCERQVAGKKCFANSELPVKESKSGVKSEVKVRKVQNELRKSPEVSNSNENAELSSEPSKLVVKEASKCSKTTNVTKTSQSHSKVTVHRKETFSESKSEKSTPGSASSGSDAEKKEKKFVLPSLRAFKPSSLERPNRNRSSSVTSDRRKSLPSTCTKSSGELSSVSSISCTDGDSQSSGSLASGSSCSVQSSHAEKMKAAKLAFLTQQSRNDVQSSSSGSSVDLRFARHSLGKSSTSLNRSNTSLNNMSLSSTSLNNLSPALSVALGDASEKKVVNKEGHKQSNTINKSKDDKKPDGLNQAGPGAHTALLADIKNFKLKPASGKHTKHVERTAADCKATRAALEARNNNRQAEKVVKSDDSAVLSILDNIKCSMKTYDFKSDDGSSAKESLNSSSEWLL